MADLTLKSFPSIDEQIGTTSGTPSLLSIELTLKAGHRLFDFELQRRRGFGTFFTQAIIRGSLFNAFNNFFYTDEDVIDGTTYFYRGRHVRADAIPGVWSKPVKAIPRLEAEEDKDSGTGDGGGGDGGGGGGGGDDKLLLLASYSTSDGDLTLL